MIERWLRQRIEEDRRIFPVVMLTGARQVGKTTLARALTSPRWRAEYRTLDDRAQLDAALADPDGFLAQARRPLILDEVQRAPDLLRAIKLVVDRDRRPGQFLVTGSANLLTMKGVSETLAGRVGVCSLFPLSWGELCRRPPAPRLEALFGRTPRDLFGEAQASSAVPPEDMVLRGGYPSVTRLSAAGERMAWFDAYQQTY
ncbi:MAG: AAA family ATPase, partial [bacterium]